MHLLLSHFYRHAALWFPTWHENVILNMKIHSVQIVYFYIILHKVYFKHAFVLKCLSKVNLIINMDDGEYFCRLKTAFRHDSSVC